MHNASTIACWLVNELTVLYHQKRTLSLHRSKNQQWTVFTKLPTDWILHNKSLFLTNASEFNIIEEGKNFLFVVLSTRQHSSKSVFLLKWVFTFCSKRSFVRVCCSLMLPPSLAFSNYLCFAISDAGCASQWLGRSSYRLLCKNEFSPFARNEVSWECVAPWCSHLHWLSLIIYALLFRTLGAQFIDLGVRHIDFYAKTSFHLLLETKFRESVLLPDAPAFTGFLLALSRLTLFHTNYRIFLISWWTYSVSSFFFFLFFLFSFLFSHFLFCFPCVLDFSWFSNWS